MPNEPLAEDDLSRQFANLDRLLEHRSRLAICVLLSREPTLSFARFKALLEESDGNLGAHLRRLEQEKLIDVDKSFSNRKPLSLYRLTEVGHNRLAKHLDALEALIANRLQSPP
ncbi:transcriptional regulator [Iodidimonas nitroreducens]|uniref:Transcriptional regulator n=1 Tax=Iodidimonas nitroreducens TaxID=1236968 RepID=A0A5A7NCS5_9PROT|nr:transcriptional regulator [Iodidimonas nitroreducens]GAK33861.1 helix-turn-helix domain protein [alpha proteobacterium Q-1]GER05280.1 transcriptional regulator [Iodidimonas nitroreducens]